MEKSVVLDILKEFGISDYTEKNEIDSSLDEDYRLNIVIDKKYVLRINNDIITEERLASIDRLVERYREIGVLAPRLYKTMSGSYSIKHGDHICYVSEYLDYSSWRDLESEADDDVIYSEVMKSIGRLANKYTDVDLSPVNSMWSLIDLSPIDVDIDEKQDNLNTLIEGLKDIGEDKLAKEIESFNEETRARIGKVYKNLPRCVIQGDLNASNIMVDKGHFVGLIDFNMAGTEVNINNFCCETNCGWFAEDFDSKDADTLYDNWVKEQNDWLEVILSEYTLNDLEKSVIDDYRRICKISMYPNVMNYLGFLEKDKEKTLRFLKRVIGDGNILDEELKLVEAEEKYADEIRAYRQEFIDCNDHMDGCGSLRKYEDPHEYIDNCRQRSSESASEEIGGHAQQFFCIRKSDNHLIGMIQYRYNADPKFQIGYSVRPCDRGHGYAKWMLRQLLAWLKQKGMTEAPIACEPSNVASEHVIFSCGGELVETCEYKGIDLKVWNISML